MPTDSPFNRWLHEDQQKGPLDGLCDELEATEQTLTHKMKNEMIESLNRQIYELAERYDRDMAARDAKIARMSQALQFYADRGNWLEESDGAYVSAIKWNASGDLWRAPWKTAEQVLARAV